MREGKLVGFGLLRGGSTLPTRAFGWGGCGGLKSGWNDAAHIALFAKEFPSGEGKALTEGGCAGAIGGVMGGDEVKRSLEEEGGVSEGNGVGPSDAFGGVGGGGWLEFNSFVVVNNAVASGGVSVPEWPPSTMVFWEGAISGGGGEEMAVIDTRVWCI